jgi:hypothetical protein
MLKFIVVLHRKKELAPEQFRTYFIEVHQLLAQKIPGLRRYKQNFVLPDPKLSARNGTVWLNCTSITGKQWRPHGPVPRVRLLRLTWTGSPICPARLGQ